MVMHHLHHKTKLLLLFGKRQRERRTEETNFVRCVLASRSVYHTHILKMIKQGEEKKGTRVKEDKRHFFYIYLVFISSVVLHQ